jgi:hypothetical protein
MFRANMGQDFGTVGALDRGGFLTDTAFVLRDALGAQRQDRTDMARGEPPSRPPARAIGASPAEQMILQGISVNAGAPMGPQGSRDGDAGGA